MSISARSLVALSDKKTELLMVTYNKVFDVFSDAACSEQNKIKQLERIFSKLPPETQKALLLLRNSNTGRNLLMVSIVMTQNLNIAKFFLKVITDLTTKGMLSATEKNQFFEETDKENNTCLVIACMLKNVDIVKVLVDYGVNINLQRFGRSALCAAARYGNQPAVEYLISKNANVNTFDALECPLLCTAVDSGNETIVKLLIKAGADIDTRSKVYGYTALHKAAEQNFKKVAESLIALNAKLDIRDHRGSTALMIATKMGHGELIPILGNASIVNHKDLLGCTALHYAVKQPKSIQALLDMGADPNVTNAFGDTPLHYAAEQNNLESVQLLFTYTKNVDPEKLDGTTPLMVASYNGNYEVAEFLLKNKANPRNVNIQGSNSLGLAINNQKFRIVTLLLEKDATLINEVITLKKLNKAGFDYIRRIAESETGKPSTDNEAFERLDAKQSALVFQNREFYNVEHILPIDLALTQCKNKVGKNIIFQILITHQKRDGDGFRTYLRSEKGAKLWTSIIYAAELEIVKAFVQVGADIRQSILSGLTPLLLAISLEDRCREANQTAKVQQLMEIVQYLIRESKATEAEHGSLLNIMNEYGGNRNIASALLSGSAAMLELLLSKGAISFERFLNAPPCDTPCYKEKMKILFSAHFSNVLNNSQKLQELKTAFPLLSEYILGEEVTASSPENNNFCFGHGTIVVNFKYGAQTFLLSINDKNLEPILSAINTLHKAGLSKKSFKKKLEIILLDFCFDAKQCLLIKERNRLHEWHETAIETATANGLKFNDKLKSIEAEILRIKSEISDKLMNPAIVNREFAQLQMVELKALEEKYHALSQDILTAKPLQTMVNSYETFFEQVAHDDFDNARKHIKTFEETAEKYIDTYTTKLNEILKKFKEQLHLVNEKLSLQNAEPIKIASKIALSEKEKQARIQAKSKKKKGKGGKGKKDRVKSKVHDSDKSKKAVMPEQKTEAERDKLTPKPKETVNVLDTQKTNGGSTALASMPASPAEKAPEPQLLESDALREYRKVKESRIQKGLDEFRAFALKERAENLAEFEGIRRSFGKGFGGPLTLDEKAGGIAAKVGAVDQGQKTAMRLERKIASEVEKTLEPWFLFATLAQHMESLLRVHKGPFSAPLANEIRDIIFYNEELEKICSPEELRTANENVAKFLKANKDLKMSREDLLKEIDPSASSEKPGLMKRLLDMGKVKTMTPEFCLNRINEGLKLWQLCCDLYQKHEGRCDPIVMRTTLGYAIAVIGCFASHLKKDFGGDSKESLERDNANKILIVVQLRCLKTLPINIDECIEIGIKFRHLNLLKRGDDLIPASQRWEEDIDSLIRSFAAPRPEALFAGPAAASILTGFQDSTGQDEKRAKDKGSKALQAADLPRFL